MIRTTQTTTNSLYSVLFLAKTETKGNKFSLKWRRADKYPAVSSNMSVIENVLTISSWQVKTGNEL
jgi:hypothetical protein